ncbi:MAG: NAAT family transporter [Candidatus Marinimicrobia bacterium]|jgi:multiple antibiotic resistance protein|nr:NAAT family transporter [Candidatus Neomarinimicrobiota bacterium]MBT3634966.1 NAAT family transporter [Candidatus Neomarinimicrobiota bacterium]MBT3760585.1 NAAT family transporter [Candidatus Neomarinimicrobiota bacterium]MBT3896922.1 NAAT family transporter [Candidatus Neomarinimicrobiota bacterium]MBT4173862.1 NAAT family transporter [Candidatus Neomarinimicrobiota bacterium]
MDLSTVLPSYFQYFLISFFSLFSLVNPIGLSPVYLSMVEHFDEREKKKVLLKAILTATSVLIIFMMIGRLIFTFFGITVDAFRIVGGILFFKMGMGMMEGKVSRTKSTPKEEEEAQDKDEIAFTPIGIPLIAGPGAITSVMILSSEATNFIDKAVFLITIIIVMVLTYIIFLLANKFTAKFGTAGLRVMQRIMGLILMVIAVQFIVNGLTPIVTGWLLSSG